MFSYKRNIFYDHKLSKRPHTHSKQVYTCRYVTIQSRQDGFRTKPCIENSRSNNFTLWVCKKNKWWCDFKFKRLKGINIWLNFWFKGRNYNFSEKSWKFKRKVKTTGIYLTTWMCPYTYSRKRIRFLKSMTKYMKTYK